MATDCEAVEDSGTAAPSQRRRALGGLSIWNLYSRVYDFLPRYVRPYQRLLADVVSAVERSTPKGGKVLDSGCGTGNLSLELGPRGYNVEGIDISQAMLQRARLKKRKAGLENVEFREWDIEKGLAIYADASFDCVVSVHALYTLREPEAAISEYLRVLKPSGHFIMAEPRSPIKIIPIVKEIYREGGLADVVRVMMTQSGVAIFNLIIGRRLRNGSYRYWDEERLGSKLPHAGFRMNSVVPAYTGGLDLLTTALKPRQYLEMNGYRFLSVESREDLEKAWRLRYEVYCVELGFWPKNQSGLEHDEYDDYAISFLAVDENDRAVGTIRFVYNNPVGFPMDPDFSLTDYMKTHGIFRGLEIGRFTIHKGVSRDAHITIALGLFKCLYDYCCQTRTYDVFAITNPKTMEKYRMAGVEIIGKPFSHSKAQIRGLWVPVHANIASARDGYDNYLRTGQAAARVA